MHLKFYPKVINVILFLNDFAIFIIELLLFPIYCKGLLKFRFPCKTFLTTSMLIYCEIT